MLCRKEVSLRLSGVIAPVIPARSIYDIVHPGVRVHYSGEGSPGTPQIYLANTSSDPTQVEWKPRVIGCTLPLLCSHSTWCGCHNVQLTFLHKSLKELREDGWRFFMIIGSLRCIKVWGEVLPKWSPCRKDGQSGVGRLYIIDRKTISKDEVDASLDVAILEIMLAVVIIQRVLVAKYFAVVEDSYIWSHTKGHSLHVNRPWWRRWRRILYKSSIT